MTFNIHSARIGSMRNCSLSSCERKHYAKGYCRPHYRSNSEESRKRWEKEKSDPTLHEKRKSYMRDWFRSNKRDYRRHADVVYFDGNREAALKRDGYECIFCGMGRDEHRDKYGVDLNVHHRDGSGRKPKADRNSELENLSTLCQSCHTKVHSVI